MNDWPTGNMRTMAITGPRQIGPVELGIPAPEPGAVLVEPRLVGLCGTDLELFHGTATYLRDGRARYPHVFGHEWVGSVRAAAADVTGWQPGDRVVGQTMVPCGVCGACLRGSRRCCSAMAEIGLYGLAGAAAPYLRLPARALVRVPDAVKDEIAALTEPAVTVIGALRETQCGLADRVAVLGTGTIGLLAIQLASRVAGRVDAFGIEQSGIELAQRCGASTATHVTDAREEAYSIVIEASGSSAAFRQSLRLVQTGGRVAVIGVANEPVDGIRPGEIAIRGIRVIGVMHGLDHYEHALGLFESGILDPAPLIAQVLRPEQTPAAFAALEGSRRGAPKLLLSFAEVAR
jgi:2-desacetyl-2-hydroxyethyl bacteriochlorophyllide A dehydrogenase